VNVGLVALQLFAILALIALTQCLNTQLVFIANLPQAHHYTNDNKIIQNFNNIATTSNSRKYVSGYQHRWTWTTLNPSPKYGFLVIFFAIWEWTAAKSLEIDQDKLRMRFSALNVDFNSVRFDPLGSRSPPYECIKFGYPLQNARFLLLSTNLAREWLRIDRLAAYHNMHCWRAFGGYEHRWPWTTLNPQNSGFCEFFAI